MKYAKYRFCFWLRKTFFECAPCVRIKEYNKLLRLHELTKQFNYAKNNYNYWHLTMHREVNVGKPSPHSQMLPYTKKSWCKRPRRLSKEKARIRRYSRRKARQIILLGEDPGNTWFNINNRNLY